MQQRVSPPPAGIVLSGDDGTFTNTERRINRVRRMMAPEQGFADWHVMQSLADAMGVGEAGDHPSQITAEIVNTTPCFGWVSDERLNVLSPIQWTRNDEAPEDKPLMHIDGFVRGVAASSPPTVSRPRRTQDGVSRSC